VYQSTTGTDGGAVRANRSRQGSKTACKVGDEHP
jgi:hypothetical protein